MSVQKLKTKAKAFGTFVSPDTGSIMYVDPNHDEERYHSPVLTASEAKEAHMRGFIEDPADAKKVTVTVGEIITGDDNEDNTRPLGEVIAERTAEHAADDAKISQQPSALDSRQSTAWQDADRVQGGAEGFADNRGEPMIAGRPATDLDPDAPPAPTPRTPRQPRKPAGS